MAFNTQANRDCLTKSFPALRNDPHFILTSDYTVRYNCIAFAMGFDDRWVQPFPDGKHFCWWPDNADAGFSEDNLLHAFEAVGFVMASDRRIEPGVDKVVLYSINGEWKHASRIVDDEIEHSKFGEFWDGKHGFNCFDGTCYGFPFAVMRRPYMSTPDLLARFPLKNGAMTPHMQLLHQLLSGK